MILLFFTGRSGLLKTFFLKIPKFVWIGCLSRTMFEGGRKNKPHNFQSLLHPSTHPACPPPRVGLPLASPLLSLGRQPKTGLQQQAQTVLTQPQQSQAVIFKPLRVFRNALCVPAVRKTILVFTTPMELLGRGDTGVDYNFEKKQRKKSPKE
jgi:hypothetical protein